MSRIQLALNVSDVDAAVIFYSKMFGVEPAKRKPGYANFVVADPPLKLVLIEADGGGTLNHLGVEMQTDEEVVSAYERMAVAGLESTEVEDSVCCYATKVETWVNDPDGAPWEFYVKTGDDERMSEVELAEDAPCCAPGVACG